MVDHGRIWLEPVGASDRCWCQHNQWGDDGVKFVRADIADARIAELEAENERLKQEVEHWKTSAASWQKIANVDAEAHAAEALSHTGAVKVKRSDILTKIALWADDEGMELSMGQGDDLADAIINRLDVAGFRILGPDEVDPVTLERCAEVTDKRARMGPQVTHEAAVALLVALPDAIRALGRKA